MTCCSWWTALATLGCWVGPALPKKLVCAQEPWNQVSPLPPSLRQPQKLTIKSGRKSKLFIYTLVCTLEFLKETASESLLLFG